MKPWWEEWPGRLEYELEALKDAGIPFERDDEAFNQGKLILELNPTVDGNAVKLIAQFPDLYPYFRFEVFAPELALGHHQNPFLKNLCLIGRETANWSPWDTLAEFIVERLPLVLKAGASEDATEVSEAEIHQGEPISDYYLYAPGAILVDSDWRVGRDQRRGRLDVGLEVLQKRIVGAVKEVLGSGGESLAVAMPAIRGMFPRQVPGKWIRLGQPVQAREARDFAQELFRHYPDLEDGKWTDVGDKRVDIIGVVFPDETEYRKEGDGWVFLVRAKLLRNNIPVQRGLYLLRGARCGRTDLIRRVPELKDLCHKKVAILGLGCVGAPSAIEFARSGVGELRVVDGDFVDPATALRWPLGLLYAGMPKAEAVREYVALNYPYTRVQPYVRQLGTALERKKSDLELLDELLDGADLIYDATAELGVQHFLSDLAGRLKIPYVMAYATTGGWGGLIARIVPGLTGGCWSCLQRALRDGAIKPPPEKPEELIQPLGCASPTFTGSGFDISQVALAGVRMAISLLSRRAENGYPLFDWDVGMLSLREKGGHPVAPRWETYQLDQNPSCESCKKDV